MEQHPIPQDVTGFQFKLIGAMTVKQFGYVAVGVISAVITYYSPFNNAFWILLKVILIPLFGSSGFIIAFVPVEGRPIDIMATNFAKAIFSPNQYVYKKTGRQFKFSSVVTKSVAVIENEAKMKAIQKPKVSNEKGKQLQAILLHSQQKVRNELDQKEKNYLDTLLAVNTQPAPILSSPAIQQPSISVNQPLVPIPPQVSNSLPQIPKEQTPEPNNANDSRTTKEATPAVPISTAAQQTPSHVYNIPQAMSKKAGVLSVSDTPNVVIGIVKDSRGNVLPNILLEVKDEDNNPVRAFKTNVLGQFASATPLTNGTYIIELEDPKKAHSFDTIKIIPSGQIMLPIEIISHDAREELRKSLFN